MSHLEEGTIHAWLDGELGAAEAATLEAHVTGCAACAALVAEARGLTAAASRILGALDDVPVGVVPESDRPTATSVNPVGPQSTDVVDLGAQRAARAGHARSTPMKRWFNPRVAAAAAVLVVAVGTMTVMQRSAVEPSFAPAAASLADAVDSVTAVVPPSSAPAEQPAPTPEVANARAAAPAPPPSVTAATAQRERAVTDASRARDAATANEASRQAADLGAVPPVRVDTVQALKAAPAPSAKRFGAMADSAVRSEERRLRDEMTAQRRSAPVSVTAGAGARASVALEERATSLRCLVIDRTPAALQLNVPARIELSNAEGPRVGDRTFFVVRAPGMVAGTEPWYWFPAGDSAFTLVQVEENPPTIRRSVTVSGASAPGAIRGTPVDCGAR